MYHLRRTAFSCLLYALLDILLEEIGTGIPALAAAYAAISIYYYVDHKIINHISDSWLFLITLMLLMIRAKEVNLKSTSALLLAMTREQEQAEILKEIEALCSMHEKISQASECREFNRRTALLLQRLEISKWRNR